MSYRYTEKRGANHSLHLVLTILTCGLWAISGWPVAAILGRKRTVRGPMPPPPYYPPQQQPPYPPPGHYGPPRR